MTTLPIRDAASLILWRKRAAPEVLMGQRGAGAVFLPSKTVFPGGAVDLEDAALSPAGALHASCRARLDVRSTCAPEALATAAIRELAEETGLLLGTPEPWSSPARGVWPRFAAAGLRPDLSALTFVFRAVTPPGRPRRFDARFFLAHAGAIPGDADDFGAAGDELSNLRWVPLAETGALEVPFVTEIVLAEIAPLIGREGPPERVPYFENGDEDTLFSWLEAQPGPQ